MGITDADVTRLVQSMSHRHLYWSIDKLAWVNIAEATKFRKGSSLQRLPTDGEWIDEPEDASSASELLVVVHVRDKDSYWWRDGKVGKPTWGALSNATRFLRVHDPITDKPYCGRYVTVPGRTFVLQQISDPQGLNSNDDYEDLFWHNELGWVSKIDATRYTEHETLTMNWPHDGTWKCVDTTNKHRTTRERGYDDPRGVYTAVEVMTAAVRIVDSVFFCADGDLKEQINNPASVRTFITNLVDNCSQNMRENAITMLTKTLEESRRS